MIKSIFTSAAIMAFAVTTATAADIEFTVHHGPGGPSDQTTRLIEKNVIDSDNKYNVVNRPGAAGKIAIKHMLKTNNAIITATMAQIYVTNQIRFKDLPYDPIKDFELVGVVATMPNVLVCNNDRKFFTVSDLENFSKKKILFGAAGYGSSEHLATEVLIKKLKIESKVIPYAKGGTTALSDLLAGNIDCMFANYPTVKNHLGANITSIMSSQDLGLDVPTWKEVYKEEFPFVSPIGLIASRNSPNLDSIKKDISNVFKRKEFVEGLKNIGLFPIAGTDLETKLFAFRNNVRLKAFLIDNNIPLQKN